MIKYIKNIKNYFKHDSEREGKCAYCGKHVKDGILHLKYNYDKRVWDTVLTCKGRCYSLMRNSDPTTISVLSKKQSIKLDMMFVIFITVISIITLFMLDYGI